MKCWRQQHWGPGTTPGPGVGPLQGPNKIYSCKKGPPDRSRGFWWRNLLTAAKPRPDREEQAAEHPHFLLRPSSLLPEARGAQLLQSPGGTEKCEQSLEAGLEGQTETIQHIFSENIFLTKKGGNHICPANLQGGCEDRAGGGLGHF